MNAVADTVRAFFTAQKVLHLKKGALIIRANEQPNEIFFLEKGFVRQYSITKNGEEMTINIFKPGSFFPASLLVDAFTEAYYFEAIDNVRLYSADIASAREFVKANPEVLIDLLHRVFVGLDGVQLRSEQLMSGSATDRLVSILIIMARRFGEVDTKGTHIRLKFTHQDLATHAGLTRETVSREMHMLKNDELIEYDQTEIRIPSLSVLEKRLYG